MLSSSLCDYSDESIPVKGTITVGNIAEQKLMQMQIILIKTLYLKFLRHLLAV